MPRANANGIGIHYQTLGTVPDIVMIHGLAANLAFWHLRIAHPLSSYYRVTTYDLRGHGYSDMPTDGYTSANMARDLRGLMDHIGIERSNIIGHSFGGAVALHFALLFPERVKTLTLADARAPALQPLPRLGEHHYWEGWRQKIQKLGINIPDDAPRVAYSFIEELAREKTLGRELQKLSQQRLLASWPTQTRAARRWRMLLELTSAMTDFPDPDGLTENSIREIESPVLAIYGEYSHCMPTCKRLTELLPKCQTVIVPRVGHLHPAVRPLNFIKHLMRFIKCHDQGQSGANRVVATRK